VSLRQETLRSIGLAFTGMAVAISMVGLGVTEPAVAKIRKGLEIGSIRSIRRLNATTSSLKIWIVSRGTFTPAILRKPRNTKARLNQTECLQVMKKARRPSSRGSTLAVAARPPHSIPPFKISSGAARCIFHGRPSAADD
jgi:hypothetical protein